MSEGTHYKKLVYAFRFQGITPRIIAMLQHLIAVIRRKSGMQLFFSNQRVADVIKNN